MTSVPKDDSPEGWILCDSTSVPGMKYYFNKKNGFSSWTRPEGDNINYAESQGHKRKKQKKDPPQQERSRREDAARTLKRKSSSNPNCEGTSRDKHVPEKKFKTSPVKQQTKVRSVQVEIIDPQRKHAYSHIKSPTAAKHNVESAARNNYDHTPRSTKSLANNRLERLRTQLQSDTDSDNVSSTSPINTRRVEDARKECRVSPKRTDASHSKSNCRVESSPHLNESKCSTNRSPSNDSTQSIPSPSQFFTVNKIISSIKAQLPEEYSSKTKAKNTFDDIEEGICNQTSEYQTKHPATPPQFVEAIKIVSAIKSKLEYRTVKEAPEHRRYSSANERLQCLRNSLTEEARAEGHLRPEQYYLNLSDSALQVKSRIADEKMQVDFTEPYVNERKPPKVHPISGTNGPPELIFVVDTNVFIHELAIIKDVLNSRIKGYTEQPTLLVPWRVINELDRLKDNNNGNGAICKRAKAAMDYLYQSLPEDDRIKGQSLRDANSHIYPCELPDDEILNCCLQQAERGKSVILLSNDKNLCNKAVVNRIRSVNITELNKLLEDGPNSSTDADLHSTFMYYKHCIYQLLANILENEMRAKFDNIWQHVLFKVPPWTLVDVLDCLLKHWIAVFNEVFPRIEHIIQELRHVLSRIEDNDPKRVTQQQVLSFRELALEVARKCQIIPEYMELAKGAVERLGRREGRAGETSVSDLLVVAAFQNVWNVFSSYCAKLCMSLDISHNLEVTVPSNDSMDMLLHKWPVFSKQIQCFTFAIKEVLFASGSGASFEEQIINLEGVFRDSLSLISIDSNINRINLKTFCTNCRNLLLEVHSRFCQLTELLDVCSRLLPSN